MAIFGVIENDVIVNIIVAESVEIAQSIFGDNIVEQTDTNKIQIGSFLKNDVWIAPQPFPSWVLENNQWVPPVPRPDDESKSYSWDEDLLSWIEDVI